jgi:hypothetical protein
MTSLREGIEGHWLEAGVWRGGTALMLAPILKVRQQCIKRPRTA